MLQKIFTSEEMAEIGCIAIPVFADVPGLCAVCETEVATKELTYRRESEGIKKEFTQPICDICLDEDLEEIAKNNEIVSIKKL